MADFKKRGYRAVYRECLRNVPYRNDSYLTCQEKDERVVYRKAPVTLEGIGVSSQTLHHNTKTYSVTKRKLSARWSSK